MQVESQQTRRASRWIPTALAFLAVLAAAWHVWDFDEDVDPEFPSVVRPTFSRYSPASYRLAEPGDTLDRIELYLASLAVVIAVTGLVNSRGSALWPTALALSLAALWHASTPGPTFDGWPGLGFRVLFDLQAALPVRLAVAAGTLIVAGMVLGNLFTQRRRLGFFWEDARLRGTTPMAILAALLIGLRQVELPLPGPVGYWPRCSMLVGLLLACWCMLVSIPPVPRPAGRTLLAGAAAFLLWLGLTEAGIALVWIHRPLARMKVIEPGRILISAMPTVRGLEIAHARHHFKTIINLFPEDTPLRSPLFPAELAFAQAHGIRYVRSPSNPSDEASNRFLDETLRLAQDPSAWPILVHCHGCMDRTPAWMGIYRFLIQGRPLAEVLREIEQHRGYRPKASVVLLYNRILPPRAGDRYWNDPTAQLLRECAHGVTDRTLAVDPREQANHRGPSTLSEGKSRFVTK